MEFRNRRSRISPSSIESKFRWMMMDDQNQKKNYDPKTISYLFYSTTIIVTCIKFLLIPAYHSTDLEVHRNWMAITYHKPLKEWYTENTSQWTLDYPPLFAYFELILAYFARFFDENMLKIQKSPYMSPETLFYLRLTVILTDLVYYYGVYVWIKLMYEKKPQLFASVPSLHTRSNFFLSSTSFIHIILFLFNVGHLIVDHIHFQYNGFLNGILLLSMANICKQNIYWGALWFAVLLNFKHIYLFMAPAYFIFLFIEHCLQFDKQSSFKIRYNVLIRLSLVVIAVFAISFLPIIFSGGRLTDILHRMFPFQRGLSHAYWAPNFWALYNGYDIFMARFYRTTMKQSPFTTGLVQQSQHLVLPEITPSLTTGIILIFLTVIMTSYIRRYLRLNETAKKRSLKKGHHISNPEIRFLHLLLLSSLTFFEFGYHIHEKSILLVVPIMIPLIFVKIDYAKLFLLLSTAGYYSLFPLLHQESETILKLILMAMHVSFSFSTLSTRYRIVEKWRQQNGADDDDDDDDYNGQFSENDDEHDGHHRNKGKKKKNPSINGTGWLGLPLLNIVESLYIYGFILVQLFYSLAPYIFVKIFERFQFLPLMIVSLYCSLGILYCYKCLFQMYD